MNIAELWMGPKIAFGSSKDRTPFEVLGFSHYGPVRGPLLATSSPPVHGGRLQASDDDAMALAELGIDLAQVQASVERKFGPGALEAIHVPAPEAADEVEVFYIFQRLAASAALRLGTTSIGFDHALAGLLNAASIERTVLRPLGLRRSRVVKRLEAQLAV